MVGGGEGGDKGRVLLIERGRKRKKERVRFFLRGMAMLAEERKIIVYNILMDASNTPGDLGLSLSRRIFDTTQILITRDRIE